MKKTAALIVALCLFSSAAYAASNPFMSMQSRLMKESNNIRLLMKNSRDVVLLTSMWDSCFIAMNQLDAYFSMIGIFETIKKQDLTEAAVNYLLSWLSDIKKTNEANITSLVSTVQVDQPTKIAVERMKINLSDLNKMIDTETNRLIILREGIRKKIVR